MTYPEKFNLMTFQKWYNQSINSNTDLVSEVDSLRKEIAKKIVSQPKSESIWYQLQRLTETLKTDITEHRNTAIFENVPNFNVRNPDDFLRHYIKSTESIINKMWRKNKEANSNPKRYLTLDNIKTKMNDIVRFSVKTDSLKSAELFAENIQNKIENKTENNAQQLFLFEEPSILSVKIDNELKMSSGYFAYHCYFKVRGAITIEMQIFSELSNHWRTLSHNIYNELRNNPKAEYKFNDLESRVVSIGHLLYLADCELHNIEEELGLSK